MRTRSKYGQRGKKMKTGQGKGVAWEREGSFQPPRQVGLSLSLGGRQEHPLSGLRRGSRVQGTLPHPCRQGAALSTWLKPPASDLPPQPRSPAPPRGEADELAAQGADGDVGAATSAAWGQRRAGGEAAEGESLASATGKGLGEPRERWAGSTRGGWGG